MASHGCTVAFTFLMGAFPVGALWTVQNECLVRASTKNKKRKKRR